MAMRVGFLGLGNMVGSAGTGQATKACNQIIDFSTVARVGEAVALGRSFGIDVPMSELTRPLIRRLGSVAR